MRKVPNPRGFDFGYSAETINFEVCFYQVATYRLYERFIEGIKQPSVAENKVERTLIMFSVHIITGNQKSPRGSP